MLKYTQKQMFCSIEDTKPRKPWYAFGYRFHDLMINGRAADYEVMNERAVRATAGLMMISATASFALAYFEGFYLPIQAFTIVAALDFAVRLFTGLATLSPFGILGSWLVRKQRPEWVGATQKRFAWSLGLVMASTVAYLVNTGQSGDLSSALCMTCIVLMWTEASLGICVGCKLYDCFIRAGLVKDPENRPACPGGACSISTAGSAH